MGVGDVASGIHPLDVLRASRWSRALFGTYALSLGFFEAAPLHALRRAGASDIRILADVSGVVGALGEAGAREVGRSYAVDPVLVDGGCFHAKLMLLDGEAGPRMAIGSGNLTFGGWGRNLELVEVLAPETAPAAFRDMANFLSELRQTDRVTSVAQPTLSSWAATMRGAAGEAGPRVLHNLRTPLAEQIADTAQELGGARRLTIASPYFGRTRAVARLATLLGVEQVCVHVPARLPMGGEHFDFRNEPGSCAVFVEELEEPSPRAMHAKMIEVVCADATLSISGSVNASGPALSSARNVELAIVRTMERQLRIRPAEMPPAPATDREESADGLADLVLTATLVGRRLEGLILSRDCAGAWSARLDATGEFRELGDVEVGPNARFAVDVQSADEIGFGSRRAVLLLQRAGRRVSGFVTFPDLIELSRRYGARAGSILRVVNGSDDDEDLAGALEYFASHADDALTPWRSGAERAPGAADAEDERVVQLDRLASRSRTEPERTWPDPGGAGAMERLLAALRRTLATGRAGQGRTAADEEDDARSGERPSGRQERTDGIFAQLCDALEPRVPEDPVAELHRLADLGVFVLSRRPDAERLAEFASWWCRMASRHLRCPADRPDLRLTATILILVDALPRRATKAARHRLASIVGGDLGLTLLSLVTSELPQRLERLLDEATAGRAVLLEFARSVGANIDPRGTADPRRRDPLRRVPAAAPVARSDARDAARPQQDRVWQRRQDPVCTAVGEELSAVRDRPTELRCRTVQESRAGDTCELLRARHCRRPGARLMRIPNLAALDEAIASRDAAHPVPPLPLVTGGVDPLGLRQLDFNLMDRCIPGLNNAAWRIRPYSVLAWAWWKAVQLAERQGRRDSPVAELRRFVDRIEVIFQAGHLAAGEFGSLPGSDGIQFQVLRNGGYDFSSDAWPTLSRARQTQGSLMSAVSYGPSAKEGLGLGYLRSDGGAFAPVQEVLPAVQAIEEALAQVSGHPAFASFECGWVAADEMASWHPLWKLGSPTAAEADVGRAALLGRDGMSPRAATLSMLQRVLVGQGEPMDVGSLRALAASAASPLATEPTSRLWRALQARQLLRVSLEGLLNWVLAQATPGPADLETMAGSLLEAIGAGRGTSLVEWLNLPSTSREGDDAVSSPVAMIQAIEATTQIEDAAACAVGLRAAIAICRSMPDDSDLFGGQAERLPLDRLSRRFEAAGALSMRDACELIVSELLIGQHVSWAVARSGDDTQRLRIVLEEGGWVALQGAGQANPTPDRLFTLLELAADCGLVAREGSAGSGIYRAAAGDTARHP